jgi:kumamolisin
MLKKLVFFAKWMVTIGITLSLPFSKAQADPVENNVDLVDSVTPFTSEVSVLGSASDDAPTEFHVALKMRDLGGLQARIDQGEQISLEELENRYFPAKEDYQRIIQWLQSKGFSVKTFPHRLVLIAQGKVNQTKNTLGVNLKRVMVEGNTYLATDQPPRIPLSIKSIVLGINGLQPYLHVNHSIESVEPESLTTPFAPPYSINDIKTAYGVNKVALDGSGQRMGIVVDVFPNNNDLTTFWRNQNIPQSLSNIEKVCTALSVNACNSPPTDNEQTLDTEMASGLAPAAKVRIYATGSFTFQAVNRAYPQILNDVVYNGIKLQQVSLSYGGCEQSLTRSQLATDSQYFASLAAAGVTVLASSGDSGSNNGCSSAGFKALYPASDVNVTGIGGTTLSLSSTGTVINETAWSCTPESSCIKGVNGGSGGGTSSYFDRPIWQVGPGVPSGTQRLTPDISLVGDPKTGVYVYVNGIGKRIGGTSAGAPLWNALTALINQNRSNLGRPPLGNLAARVYPLINTPNLRDITTGTNGAFQAGPGYDQVTGVGVPVFNQLVNTLSQ